ncbi:MAG: type II secretion system protein GspE [Desulfobulbaceae bacterium A2]|nr:MAG: type II secretion system protein GspE [Desulfobulbaceae bacterium A2]
MPASSITTRSAGLPLAGSLLAESMGLDYLAALPPVDPFFIDQVPNWYLKKFLLLPLTPPPHAAIAMADPRHCHQLDDLRRLLGWDDVRLVLAPAAAVTAAINLAYNSRREATEQVLQDLAQEDPARLLSEIGGSGGTADLLDDIADAPVIKLVNLILSRAVRDGASDIHVEPYQGRVIIRERIDGILHDVLEVPKQVQGRLLSRLKIMARLDIAEKRLPQDGRLEVRLAGRLIDIRVATLPTAFGERMVLRLLDQEALLLPLAQLGMDPEMLSRFAALIRASHGIVLVTGPTGSGKTTTLYSALQAIRTPELNIITIEDPVEYQIEGIGQVQVNPRINLTFANGLRSIVRQDPDVILVGEIRDRETAEIAIQAALTGHLVFSTLHTNDAASAVTRLIDMGIEPFLVSSAVGAILAQRLVRRICPDCAAAAPIATAALTELGIDPAGCGDWQSRRGRGCAACLQTGYRGRIGIFELMAIGDSLQNEILATADAGRIRRRAIENGMIPLRQDGLRKVAQGRTTLEEVVRVTEE